MYYIALCTYYLPKYQPSNASYWTMIKCVSGVCVLGHPSVLCVCMYALHCSSGVRREKRRSPTPVDRRRRAT